MISLPAAWLPTLLDKDLSYLVHVLYDNTIMEELSDIVFTFRLYYISHIGIGALQPTV